MPFHSVDTLEEAINLVVLNLRVGYVRYQNGRTKIEYKVNKDWGPDAEIMEAAESACQQMNLITREK
jgi:hypothetical protein